MISQLRTKIAIAVTVIAASASGRTLASDAEWIFNGSGNYSDVSKWNLPLSPCNVGPTSFDVFIPEPSDISSSGTVSGDLINCEIDSITLGENYTLNVMDGNSLTILGSAMLSGSWRVGAGAQTAIIGAATLSGNWTIESGGQGSVDGQTNIFGLIQGLGGDFSAPTAAFPGNRVRVTANDGANVTIGASSYSSTGLTFNNGGGGANAVFTPAIMTASGPGTLLDLSGLISIDAGFSQNSDDINRQEVAASGGATLDLSGVESVVAPVQFNDWIRFSVSDVGTSLDLSSLASVGSSGGGLGRTRFEVTADGTLSLPALHAVNNADFILSGTSSVAAGALATVADSFFILNGGSQFTETGIAATYNSRRLTFNNGGGGANAVFTPAIMTASGPGTLLDLSGLISIDAGFSQNSDDINRQEVAASGGATLDLSGVESVVAPVQFNDWIRFSVSDVGTSLDLSSLASVGSSGGGLGRTRFEVTADGTLSLPALHAVNNADFILSGTSSVAAGALATVADSFFILNGGSQFTETGIAATYNSRRLTFNNGGGGANAVFTPAIMTASGPGTLLDLSGLISIDAGFSQNSDDINRQEVAASGGATLDLSGVESVVAPVQFNDWIRFSVSDVGTSLDLSSLASVGSSGGGLGRTRFEVTADGTLSLPALHAVNNADFILSGTSSVAAGALATVADSFFILNGGSQFTETGIAATYNSRRLTFNNGGGGANAVFTPAIMTASGPGTLLDLSGLISIDAGFSQNSDDINRQEVAASGGATVDLSRVRTVTAPSFVNDWIRFNVESGGMIDLSGIDTIDGNSQVRFLIADGTMFVGPLSDCSANVSIDLSDASSHLLAPRSFEPSTNVSLSATAGALLSVTGNFSFAHTDELDLILEDARVELLSAADEPLTEQTLEVGGFDLGAIVFPGENFGFGQLAIGTSETATVRLIDAVDNGNGHDLCAGAREALYLLAADANGDALTIENDSTLNLNGVNLYSVIGNVLTHINAWVTPGVPLPFGNGTIEAGDANDMESDGVPDNMDNCVLVYNADQLDTNGDGYGNVCDPDLDNNGIVNFLDLQLMKIAFFANPASPNWNPDADFNGDNFINFGDLTITRALFFSPPGPSCVAP